MTIATAVVTLLLSAPGAPQAVPLDGLHLDKAAARAARQQREAFVKGLPRGATFRSNGQTYQMAGNLRALPASPRHAPEQVLAAAGLGSADLVERKGPYLVVREAGAMSQAVQTSPSGAFTHPVAVNAGTGALGVVTGTVAVRLRSAATAVAIARDHGLELEATATGIRAAFYRVGATEDVVAAAAALARDRRVRSAEVEVREAFRELH